MHTEAGTATAIVGRNNIIAWADGRGESNRGLYFRTQSREHDLPTRLNGYRRLLNGRI